MAPCLEQNRNYSEISAEGGTKSLQKTIRSSKLKLTRQAIQKTGTIRSTLTMVKDMAKGWASSVFSQLICHGENFLGLPYPQEITNPREPDMSVFWLLGRFKFCKKPLKIGGSTLLIWFL